MKKGPLNGIKILDFSQVLAAPFCGMLLADLGASVTKIERPGGGDLSREYGPYVNNVSLYFCQFNRGKKSIAIDMRSEEGKKIVLDLVKEADIVIENYKAGTLEKLGIGYEEMLKVNPKLIYGSICGFGLYGPLSHLPCMDIIAAARSGLVDRTGEDGGVPIKPGFSMCDTWAGLHLLRALSMSLLHRQKTGRGSRIDIAMLDCAFYMCEWPILEHSSTGSFARKTGNQEAFFAPSGLFKANDGYVALSITTEEQWQKLCKTLDVPALLQDTRFEDNAKRVANKEALIEGIEKKTSTLGRYGIEKILKAAGVPGVALQTIAEFASNQQTQAINVFVKIDQPAVGEYTAVANPMHFSKTPTNPHQAAAGQPGAHSLEVMHSLGYPESHIDMLIKTKVVQAV